MKWQIKNKLANIPLRIITGIILFLILLFVFALLAHVVVSGNEYWFDTEVFTFFRSHSSPAMISVFNRITFLGSTTFLFPVYALVVLYLIYKRRWADAIHVALLVFITTISTDILKVVFARKRPELPMIRELTDYSFPSGHSLQAFVFCCVMNWLLWKTGLANGWKILISIILVLIAIAVAISRIVLRYHYPSDVMAGMCVAFAWVILYFFAFNMHARSSR